MYIVTVVDQQKLPCSVVILLRYCLRCDLCMSRIVLLTLTAVLSGAGGALLGSLMAASQQSHPLGGGGGTVPGDDDDAQSTGDGAGRGDDDGGVEAGDGAGDVSLTEDGGGGGGQAGDDDRQSVHSDADQAAPDEGHQVEQRRTLLLF